MVRISAFFFAALALCSSALSSVAVAAIAILDAALPVAPRTWRDDSTPRSIFQTRRMGLA